MLISCRDFRCYGMEKKIFPQKYQLANINNHVFIPVIKAKKASFSLHLYPNKSHFSITKQKHFLKTSF